MFSRLYILDPLNYHTFVIKSLMESV